MKYTDSHEWIDQQNQIGVVGITKYAQKELGEIVYLELPKVGQRVDLGDEICVLESTKAASDIYTPVSGKVVEVNTKLKEDLSLLNEDPEKLGWLFKVELEDLSELELLYDHKQYLELVSS
jgi:glycine cleavage system H protein